jgi:hypothetical protein
MGGRGSSSGSSSSLSPFSERALLAGNEEVGFVYDENGKLIDKGGGGFNDTIPESFFAKGYQYWKDKTMVHNHPSGRPLSVDDLRTLSQTGLKEIRAVGKRNGKIVEYIMTNKSGRKAYDHELITIHNDEINRRIINYTKRNPQYLGKILPDKIQDSIASAANRKVAKQFGWEYKVIVKP